MTPGNGLTFPDDTVVIPLEASPSSNPLTARRQWLSWTPEQNLARLAQLRTPTQYVTSRVFPTDHHLHVAHDAEGHVTVNNQLGTNIKLLLVCADDGQLFTAETVTLAPFRLEPLDSDAARTTTRDKLLLALNRDRPRAFHR